MPKHVKAQEFKYIKERALRARELSQARLEHPFNFTGWQEYHILMTDLADYSSR